MPEAIKRTSAEMKKCGKTMLKDQDILAGVATVLCFSFLVCIYAPYELYLTNPQDFWFSASLLLKPTFMLFAILFAAGTAVQLLSRLISRKLYSVMMAAALVVLLATYIQGTFLVSGLPPMDGTLYDWSQASPERIKSIAAWLIPAAAIIFVGVRFRRKGLRYTTVFVSVILLFMLLTSFVSLFISNRQNNVLSEETLICSDKGLYQMSDDQNLVVLVLDAVDSTNFTEALLDTPEYKSVFDGFTYYNNVLSGYVYTRESFPFFLSGEWYRKNEDFLTYQNRVISESPLINALEEKEYGIGIYAEFDERLQKEIFDGRFENFIEYEANFRDILSASKVVIRMAGIRYAPWDLKQYMYTLNWAVDESRDLMGGYNYYDWANELFYGNICKDQPFELVEKKNCRIIHLIGGHNPFQYDENVNVIPKEDGTYRKNIDACITICREYFDALRENGLYDNTAIVIMADHGLSTDEETKFTGRVNPILLIKGINEHHAIEISEAPLSQEDYARSFVGLLDGKFGNEIFKFKEGDIRERHVMLYEYDDVENMEEYVTTGKASDYSELRPAE